MYRTEFGVVKYCFAWLDDNGPANMLRRNLDQWLRKFGLENATYEEGKLFDIPYVGKAQFIANLVLFDSAKGVYEAGLVCSHPGKPDTDACLGFYRDGSCLVQVSMED